MLNKQASAMIGMGFELVGLIVFSIYLDDIWMRNFPLGAWAGGDVDDWTYLLGDSSCYFNEKVPREVLK